MILRFKKGGGYFNIPLCVGGGMWRLGCVGQHFTKDRLSMELKENILNVRSSDFEIGPWL